jgi:uncharacterized membrane protein YphA (DoxX/SURF4 family)
VQRLYSMFPAGGVGGALLLLRLSVAGAYLSAALYRQSGSCLVWSGWVQFPIVVLLSIGFMTPICSVLCCVYELAVLLTCVEVDSALCLLGIAITIAITFLGPGAYSVDSRLFGRRVIERPSRPGPKQ